MKAEVSKVGSTVPGGGEVGTNEVRDSDPIVRARWTAFVT